VISSFERLLVPTVSTRCFTVASKRGVRSRRASIDWPSSLSVSACSMCVSRRQQTLAQLVERVRVLDVRFSSAADAARALADYVP
jgi:hypothetical protein